MLVNKFFGCCYSGLHFVNNLVQVGNTKFCASPIMQRQKLTLPVNCLAVMWVRERESTRECVCVFIFIWNWAKST